VTENMTEDLADHLPDHQPGADAPLVSVGVPVYNGAATIARALDSLLAQDIDPATVEIVVCDNASTDDTVDICAGYAARDPRIRLHRNPRNLGLAGNYNRTVELARGRYFKWATHDDWHDPRSLRLTVEAMESSPGASVCATGVSWVDEHGVEFERWIPSVDLATPPAHERMQQVVRTMGETHPMYGLLRTDALRRTQGMRSFVGSDRTMIAELALLGPIVQVSDVLHFYTVSRPARQGYRPSLTYDPANKGRLPLRTWRLIYEHLAVVARSDLGPVHKAEVAGTVLRRFAVRDARRLAAEAYHTSRILGARAVRWRPGSAA
jgi:glycosyltransferase involved in cell wall biosynthesis